MKNHLRSRREFLKTSATAATGLSLGLAAHARDDGAPPEKFLRLGVIGYGNRASRHLPAIKNSSAMEILGVCDVRESQLAQGLEAAGSQARGYADYQKLLANSDINAVLVTTPNFVHSEMVISALEAGKHVLCEKPMGLSLAQCQAMKKAAAGSGRTVLYTMQLRYSPYWQEIRRQIEAGRIGRPKHLQLTLYRGDWNPLGWLYTDSETGRRMNWRFSQAASGGPLVEEGVHYLDLLHWMAGGLPRRVLCQGGIAVYSSDGRDTWDHAVTTLGYEGGCLATLDVCLFGPTRLELQVLGDGGTLHAMTDSHSLWFEPRSGSGQRKEPIALPPEISHGKPGIETAVAIMYQDFINCIKSQKKPWMDADKAMAACQTALLAELSAARNREVGWDELA